MKHALEGLDKDFVMTIPACCWTILQGANGQSSIPRTPVMHTAFGLAAPTATGLKAGFEMTGRDPTVVVWGGDGSTYGIGFGAISGAAERNDDILYICYNNQAYMNTGIQRSSATMRGAVTTTTPKGAPKEQLAKNMPEIMRAHGVPYVATATPAFFKDLQRKVARAKAMKGFRYIEILIPCPAGWKFSSDMTVVISRLAVQTGLYPLMEIENGQLTSLKPGNPAKLKPVEEYFKTQRRYSELSRDDMAKYQELAGKNLEKLKNELKKLSSSPAS